LGRRRKSLGCPSRGEQRGGSKRKRMGRRVYEGSRTLAPSPSRNAQRPWWIAQRGVLRPLRKDTRVQEKAVARRLLEGERRRSRITASAATLGLKKREEKSSFRNGSGQPHVSRRPIYLTQLASSVEASGAFPGSRQRRKGIRRAWPGSGTADSIS